MDLIRMFCVLRNKRTETDKQTNKALIFPNIGSKMEGRRLRKKIMVCNYGKVISKNIFLIKKY